MLCAAHPDLEAHGPCAACFKNLCEACATYDLDGAICCERCGRAKEDEGNALSSGLLALIAVGYLATLAVGILVFKPRPFVGGLAAIVAIALGRLMQVFVKTNAVTRRVSRTSTTASTPTTAGAGTSADMPAAADEPAVDATAPPL